MSLKFSRNPTDFRSVLKEIVEPPFLDFNSRQFEFNAQAVRDLNEIAEAMNEVATVSFAVPLPPPATPIADASVAAAGNAPEVIHSNHEGMINQIVESAEGYPYFGKVSFLDKHTCKFRYCDSRRTHGLMHTTYRIEAHEHDLINVRVRKLDDEDVVLTQTASRIVRMLPEVLLPYVRIITGTVILTKQNDAGVEKSEHVVGRAIRRTAETIGTTVRGAATLAGQAASSAGQAVRNHGGKIATGVAAVGALGLLGSFLATAAKVAVVAAADPALVIGDLVLTGWMEE